MTIYVDNAGIPATVTDSTTRRTYTSRWCHLCGTEIDPTELHEFAARIGLKRAWFEPGKSLGRSAEHDPVGDHYDLTAKKRRLAIKAGAMEVSLHQASELYVAKCVAWKALLENAATAIAHEVGDWEPDDEAHRLAWEALTGTCALDWVNETLINAGLLKSSPE